MVTSSPDDLDDAQLVSAVSAAEILRRAADARQDPDDDEDWRAALAEIQREVLSR